MKLVSVVIIILCFVGSASSSYAKPDKYLEAARNNLSFREADSYSNHSAKRDVEVGIEQIHKDEIERLLGGGTGKFKIFDVAVTNNSDFRIYVNRIDFRNAADESYPRVSLNDVVEAIDPGGRGNKDDMREAVLRTNILGKSLPHAVLNPGETVQGMVFIKDKNAAKGTRLYLQIQNLKRVAYLDFSILLDK